MNNKLKNFRNKRGLTQQQLAKTLGVSRQTIITIEKSECVPSLQLAMKLAKFFKVPVEELFC